MTEAPRLADREDRAAHSAQANYRDVIPHLHYDWLRGIFSATPLGPLTFAIYAKKDSRPQYLVASQPTHQRASFRKDPVKIQEEAIAWRFCVHQSMEGVLARVRLSVWKTFWRIHRRRYVLPRVSAPGKPTAAEAGHQSQLIKSISPVRAGGRLPYALVSRAPVDVLLRFEVAQFL